MGYVRDEEPLSANEIEVSNARADAKIEAARLKRQEVKKRAHTSLEVEGFILNHDPATCCIDKERIWLCGRIHDLFIHQRNVLNVGVDVWDYTPVGIETIRKYVKECM